MPEVKQTIEVNVSPDEMYEVITNFDRYPEFISDLLNIVILDHEDEFWVVEEEIHVIKKFKYTLTFKGEKGKKLSWSLVEGSFKKNQGDWTLEKLDENRTLATYRLEIDVGLFVPGAIMKALVGSNLPKLLNEFKNEAESRYVH